MHHHMGQILAALLVGGIALILSRCGVLPTPGEDQPEDDAATPAVVATTTTTTEALTTTTAAPVSTTSTTVAVAPVLQTENPDELAYCFAAELVPNVLATGIRGEVTAIATSIDQRSRLLRALTPPIAIEEELQVTLAAAEAVVAVLTDTERTVEEKDDALAQLLTDSEYRSAAATLADFEEDVCLID